MSMGNPLGNRRSASFLSLLTVSVLVAVLLSGFTLPGSLTQIHAVHLAVVSKVVREVARKEVFKDWQIVKCGEMLSSGDMVKTGENSFALIRFKDNSFVRVRGWAELTVKGTTEGPSFSKSVNLESGSVGFKITKQRSDEKFRFTSPISVASIRGTGGKFVSAALSDTLTVIEGEVLLTNATSFAHVVVRAGYMGISNSDGAIFVRMATSAELTTAGRAASDDEEMIHGLTWEGDQHWVGDLSSFND